LFTALPSQNSEITTPIIDVARSYNEVININSPRAPVKRAGKRKCVSLLPDEKNEMLRKAPRLSDVKHPTTRNEKRIQIMEDVIDAFDCSGELSHKNRLSAFAILINYLYYDRNLTESQISLITVHEFANLMGQWNNGKSDILIKLEMTQGSKDRRVYTLSRLAVSTMRVYFLGARQQFLGNGCLPAKITRTFEDDLFIETHPFFINSKGRSDFRVRLVAAPMEEKLEEAVNESESSTDILTRKIKMLLKPPVNGNSVLERPHNVAPKIEEILDEQSGKGVFKQKNILATIKKCLVQYRHMRVNLRAMEYYERFFASNSAGEEKRLSNFYAM
jgi:hypothetical protein